MTGPLPAGGAAHPRPHGWPQRPGSPIGTAEDASALTVEDAAALTAWAADCADHALARFPDFADAAANAAISAARAWAASASAESSESPPVAGGRGSDGMAARHEQAVDLCREAAVAAHLSARDLAEAGYHAVAAGVRAAGNAAASADDPELALVAADYAMEALAGNSAACELPSQTAAERRWQWSRLPKRLRGAVFDAEPPEPPEPACTL